MLVVKDDLLIEKPWLEREIYQLFKTAKDSYVESLPNLDQPNANDVQTQKMGKIVGGDPLPYDLNEAYSGIDRFIKFNVDQKIIPEPVNPESLFAMPK